MRVSKKGALIGISLCCLAYGLVIVHILQALYDAGDGDVVRYVNFFQNQDLAVSLENFSFKGDGVFRVSINFLKAVFAVETITILSALAFLTSSTVLCLAFTKIQSNKKTLALVPLACMVFLSPMIVLIFADQIRSTLAFTVFLLALMYAKGFVRYSSFALAGGLHFAMLPIISVYFGYHILAKLRVKSDFMLRLSALVAVSLGFCLVAAIFQFNVTPAFQGQLYNIAILYLAMMMLVTNKEVLNNIFGFISVALMLTYFFGQLLDVAFIRYVSYAIVLYFFFLLEQRHSVKVSGFMLSYAPFFLLTVTYKMSNIGLGLL